MPTKKLSKGKKTLQEYRAFREKNPYEINNEDDYEVPALWRVDDERLNKKCLRYEPDICDLCEAEGLRTGRIKKTAPPYPKEILILTLLAVIIGYHLIK